MEKGETGIIIGQFAALVVVILLLSNFVAIGGIGVNNESTPKFGSVYWGARSSGVPLSAGTTNQVGSNQSTISVYYALAVGTRLTAATAERLCSNHALNNTGPIQVYSTILKQYDPKTNSLYLSFGPTGQNADWICTYTVTITDSLLQTTTWQGMVQLKPGTH